LVAGSWRARVMAMMCSAWLSWRCRQAPPTTQLLRGQSWRVQRLADQSGELVDVRLVGLVELAPTDRTRSRLRCPTIRRGHGHAG
jgi:hypothetical protein